MTLEVRCAPVQFEAARRPRWLISNFAFVPVPVDTKNVLLQEVLNPGSKALADKAGCIISGTLDASRESVATARAHSQRNRGREVVLCSSHGTDVRGLLVMELARALGQPYYEVDAAAGGEAAKAGLLGRSFAIGMINHALQTLIQACLAAHQKGANVSTGAPPPSNPPMGEGPSKWQRVEESQRSGPSQSKIGDVLYGDVTSQQALALFEAATALPTPSLSTPFPLCAVPLASTPASLASQPQSLSMLDSS